MAWSGFYLADYRFVRDDVSTNIFLDWNNSITVKETEVHLSLAYKYSVYIFIKQLSS